MEDMGLATTYIVAMFAIFVSLLSFILSSYGGQVTTRSSSHPMDGDMDDMGLATTYIVAMFAIFVSLLSFILFSYGGQVTTRSSSNPKDDVGLKGTVSQRLLSQGISRGHTKRSDAL
jgi:hypothetical protein